MKERYCWSTITSQAKKLAGVILEVVVIWKRDWTTITPEKCDPQRHFDLTEFYITKRSS